MANKPIEKYVVIGRKAGKCPDLGSTTSTPRDRQFFDSAEDAAVHAQQILLRNCERWPNYMSTPRRFYVAKVVGVVELAPPPISVRGKLKASDFPKES